MQCLHADGEYVDTVILRINSLLLIIAYNIRIGNLLLTFDGQNVISATNDSTRF